jgi:hypothetical protein
MPRRSAHISAHRAGMELDVVSNRHPPTDPLTALVTSPVCGAAGRRYRHNGRRFHTHRLYAPGERPGGPPLTLYLRTGRILHIRARRVL